MNTAPATSRSAIVIGASFAGLLAAAAASQAGYSTTILERDRLSETPEPRPGVPQGEQAHVLLRRGLVALESLLPGIEKDFHDHGGHPFNTSQMPWLSEYGWMPQTSWSHEIISLSRPLIELLVRRRVETLPGVTIREGIRVTGLQREADRWVVLDHDQVIGAGGIVIDASGRSSRLPHWLGALGITVPEARIVEAKLGYASRLYRGALPFSTGAAVVATPVTRAGALILPVEHDGWIFCASGYGDRRPGRTPQEFEDFLTKLRDPVVAAAARALEPAGEVSLHRQTSNRRMAYGTASDWPAGLFVVGDALCAFNPLYGQGITVAATQAALLRAVLAAHDGSQRSTRRIQRRLAKVVDFPWSVATTEDLRQPTCDGERNLVQRVFGRWTTRMGRLAAAGDEACTRAFADVYHLMGSSLRLFGPSVVRAVLRSLVRGVPEPAQRPEVLSALADKQSTGPTADRSSPAQPTADPAQHRAPFGGSTPLTR